MHRFYKLDLVPLNISHTQLDNQYIDRFDLVPVRREIL